jgi:hypothetical protein
VELRWILHISPGKNKISPGLGLIEIIKGSAIFVISPETKLNLVNFLRHVLPYDEIKRRAGGNIELRPNWALQGQIFPNSCKQSRPAVQKAEELSARLSRKVTAHGSRRTIQAGKRQVMETKGSALQKSQTSAKGVVKWLLTK